jgi:S-adenosylmethionine:tRNA ribosyltransferase-isomerase
MKASEFDYDLPEKLIAQKPAEPRESARLLVLDRLRGTTSHRTVGDLSEYLGAGDVVVVNVSKVFNARLHGKIGAAKAELFLVKPVDGYWECIGKPGKKLVPGATVAIAEGFEAKVVEKHPDGALIVDFGLPKEDVVALANKHGEIPTPPYIRQIPKDNKDYQTVYARTEGSVAAPTAGFHLTKPLIAKLKKKGVEFLEVTLHVGLGTFMPIRGEELGGHRMHGEWVEIPEATVAAILKAKIERRRVVAVGTTTVRALEGAVARCGGELCAWHGEVDLFITPGFDFQVVDAMMTNFHLPKSTLLVLVSSFAGRERVLGAYREAVTEKYRFYSFGDAMLIL